MNLYLSYWTKPLTRDSEIVIQLLYPSPGLLKSFLELKYFLIKNISDKIFLNYLYYKSFLMNILLILNSKSTSLKIKTFFNYKKAFYQLLFLYVTYKTGFYMFLFHFFQLLSLLRFCVNFVVKVKGPLYDEGILMVTFSAYLRNNQHQNLHIFIPLLPFACVDESNRLKLSKRRSWFFPQELYKADFTKALTKFLPQKKTARVLSSF